MVAQKAQAEKTRGEGPIKVAFANATAKDLSRPSNDVTGLVILDRKSNKTISLDVAKVPEGIRNALVLMAVAGRVKTYVNNHAGDEKGKDVPTLIEQVWADVLAGKIYSRTADGKAPGRKFDANLYVEASRYAIDFMAKKGLVDKRTGKPIQPMSEKGATNLKVKLEAMTPKDQRAWINKQNANNPIFRKRLLELKASKVDTSDMEMIDL